MWAEERAGALLRCSDIPAPGQGAYADADELRGMRILRDLGERLVPEGNPQVLYEEVLQAAMQLAQADGGTLQLLDEASQELRLLVTRGFATSMTERFARVDAGSDTSCGLALRTGMRNVVHFDEPGAPDPHGALRAHVEAGYRSAQSTPLVTRAGRPIGMLSTHWHTHHVPAERDLHFIDLLARQAADLIDRKTMEDALRTSQAQFQRELDDVNLLQQISTQLLQADDVGALHEQLLDVAMSILDADFGSVQKIDPLTSEPLLLAWRGFGPGEVAQWARVSVEARTPCGASLQQARRVVVEDIERWEPLAGSPELEPYRRCGIRAVQCTPLLARNGKPVGILATQWRTPHVPGARELRLLDVIARQAADLIERRRSEEQLREADRRKDEFLATLAHELRNPLAPLRHGIQIARVAGQAEPRLQGVVDMMDRQLAHLVRLVDDLLDVGRIRSGKLTLQRRAVRLAEVLRSSVEASRALMESGGQSLQLDAPDLSLRAYADFDRLVQVFTNLLSNAAKYSGQGSVVRLRLEQDGNHAVVQVSDEGIGIPATELPHVFDMFSQVRSHQGRADGGLGIGLSIVRSLVAMHGGTVSVASDGPGRGSRFTVRLPLFEPAATEGTSMERSTAPPRPREAAASLCVLVADDNADAGDSLAMLLQLHGHQVTIARDGVEAVAHAGQRRPDLALLDIGMPRMDGIEAARRLRRLPDGDRIVIAAVTGWGQASDRLRTQEAGFDLHLVKPIDEPVLLDAVERARKSAPSGA